VFQCAYILKEFTVTDISWEAVCPVAERLTVPFPVSRSTYVVEVRFSQEVSLGIRVV